MKINPIALLLPLGMVALCAALFGHFFVVEMLNNSFQGASPKYGSNPGYTSYDPNNRRDLTGLRVLGL